MKTYSEKELQIFGGVLRLISDGNDLAGITSRKIARSAGIGKSTIYDYFTSKDDVINKAIIYSFEKHIEKLMESVSQGQGFKEKMCAIFRHYIDSRVNASFMLNTVSAYGGIRQLLEQAHSDEVKSEVMPVIQSLEGLYKDVLALGRKSGAIQTGHTEEYVRQVVQSVTAGVCAPVACCCDRQTINNRIENAYTMLVKALN